MAMDIPRAVDALEAEHARLLAELGFADDAAVDAAIAAIDALSASAAKLRAVVSALMTARKTLTDVNDTATTGRVPSR